MFYVNAVFKLYYIYMTMTGYILNLGVISMPVTIMAFARTLMFSLNMDKFELRLSVFKMVIKAYFSSKCSFTKNIEIKYEDESFLVLLKLIEFKNVVSFFSTFIPHSTFSNRTRQINSWHIHKLSTKHLLTNQKQIVWRWMESWESEIEAAAQKGSDLVK